MPALAERARLLFLTGRLDEAEATVDEMLENVDPRPTLDWSWWFLSAAIVLTDVGRAQDLLDLGGEDLPTGWVQAGRLWATGDLAGAADRLQEVGSAPDEAYARVKEAERLIAAGRRAEAEPFLSRALELYRGMGATAFTREAELLLAPPA